MGRFLVVFTTALFLSALFQCCVAAGGTSPCEDPTTAYLSVIIANRLFYDITSQDSSSPSGSVIKGWIVRINETLKCCLKYSQRLATILVNRANYIRQLMKGEGGRRRHSILSKNWTLKIPGDVKDHEEMAKLQQQVKSLKGIVKASTRILHEIQETPTRRKRTNKHYSKRHEYRIKRQRVEDCTATLAWLENEGLTPVNVTVVTGPEKLKLFQKLNITETFPEVPNCVDVQALWNELLEINRLLSVRPKDLTQNKISEFESRSKGFVRMFTELYPAKHVTPYMHCMMQHVGQFMNTTGALLPFTQQGLEKYNDTMMKDYFRSTSHKGQDCLKQMLQKQNRIEQLEHAGAKREKAFEIKCSNCGSPIFTFVDIVIQYRTALR